MKNIKINTLLKFFLVILVCMLFNSCHDSSNNESSQNNTTESISGFINDNFVSNFSSIKLKNTDNIDLCEFQVENDGSFMINYTFKKNDLYVLETMTGESDENSYTLHTIFQYTNNNDTININSFTEIQYLLTKEAINLTESEILIREYFIILIGKNLYEIDYNELLNLDNNIKNLAMLLDKSKPSDIFDVIIQDILNETNSYSASLKQTINILTTENIIEINNPITATLEINNSQQLELDNEKYTLKWTGILDKNIINETSNTITFSQEYPEEKIITAVLLNKNDNRILDTVNTKIIFYEQTAENSIKLTNNVTTYITEDMQMSISETNIESIQVSIKKYDTCSSEKIAMFDIKTDEASTDSNLTVLYNYNPSLVNDPRLLNIYLQKDSDAELLNIKSIDYENHLIEVNLPIFSSSSSYLRTSVAKNNKKRFFGLDSGHSRLIIERDSTKQPTKYDIITLAEKYSDILKKIISSIVKDETKANQIYNNLSTNEGLSRLYYFLSQKNKLTGNYLYDDFSRAINNEIAYQSALSLFDSVTDQDFPLTWELALKSYILNKYEFCISQLNNYCIDRHNNLRNRWMNKILRFDAVISNYVGNAKLSKMEQEFIKYSKACVNLAVAIYNLDPNNAYSKTAFILKDMTGIGLDLSGSAEITGYAYNALYDTADSLVQKSNRFSLSSWVTSITINETFKAIEQQMIDSKKYAMAPILLSFAFYNEKTNFSALPLHIVNGDCIASPYQKNVFLDIVFPQITDCSSVSDDEYSNRFYCENRKLIENASTSYCETSCIGPIDSPSGSQLSNQLDPNGRLEKLFLTKGINSSDPIISNNKRFFAFLLMRFAFGEKESGDLFKSLTDFSNAFAFAFIANAADLGNTDIGMYEITKYYTPGIFDCTGKTTLDIYNDGDYANCFHSEGGEYIGTETVIKSEYLITTFDILSKRLGLSPKNKKRINKKTYNRNSVDKSIVNLLKNVMSFQSVLSKTKLSLTQEQKVKLVLNKINLQIIGSNLISSFSNEKNESNVSIETFFVIGNEKFQRSFSVNDIDLNSFRYDSKTNLYTSSLEDMFYENDFSEFDNKIIGLKIQFIYTYSGEKKYFEKSYVFTTFNDLSKVLQKNYAQTVLLSSIKDVSNNKPLSNSKIHILPVGIINYTDENGNYTFNELVAGSYVLTISKEGYLPVTAQVTLSEGEVKTFEATLIVDDESFNQGNIQGTIKDALYGNFNADVLINIRAGQNNLHGDIVKNITTDEFGYYSATLLPGVYTAEILKPTYLKSSFSFSILSDQEIIKDFSITPVINNDECRIVLTWGEGPSDLDSHLWRTYNNNLEYHIYWQEKTIEGIADSLDYDYTNSYGPETITIYDLKSESTYSYYVHNYSEFNNQYYNLNQDICPIKNSNSIVNVYVGNQNYTFYPPNQEGRYWKVFDIINSKIVPCSNNCMLDEAPDFENGTRRDININKKSLVVESIKQKHN